MREGGSAPFLAPNCPRAISRVDSTYDICMLPHMSDKVVGFISPQGYVPPTLEEVMALLRMDPAGAANVFVRVTKKMFADSVGEPQERKVDENVLAHPTWVSQQSVCICLEVMTDEDAAKMVATCLHRVVNSVVQEAGDKAVMIGAFSAKLHDLGKNFYNFTFKQRFTVGVLNG